MHPVRATIRLCALLVSLTALGCSSDDNSEENGSGGSAGTSTNKGGATSATGGAKATGGASATTGGKSSTLGGAAGTTAVATGGSSTVAGASSGGSGNTGSGVGGSTIGTAGATGAVAGTNAGQAYSISGTVTGLSGAGLSLYLGSGAALDIAADGAFVFPNKIAAGTAVTVSVATQPTAPLQICTVSASGTIASLSKDVTDVAVTCVTNTFTVGGSVTGLTGTGLVLQDNAGDDTPIAADGTFVFPTKVASGKAFTVTIKTQPSAPTQTCSVSGGSGTIVGANISTVTVNCATNSYTIGGTVAGLAGTGLVLQNNAGDDVTPSSNGSFSFATPVLSGQPFAVTVKTQPTAKTQTCVVTSGTGTVASGNVTTVSVDCTTNKYPVSGTITGLSGAGLTLQNNLGDNLAVTASSTTFAFSTSVASGDDYGVTVLTQPNTPTQVCTVTGGTGTITNAAVTNVSIACATSSFTVGGNIVGMTKTGLVLLNNGADALARDENGAFAFSTALLSGTNYAVTIGTQPTGEICSVSGGTGTVGGANVTAVTVNCSTDAYTVGGTVKGLSGSGLQVVLNGTTTLPLSSNGTYAFSTPIAKGGAYEVTIAQQPSSPAQTCLLTNPTGTVASEAVTNVAIQCYVNSYTVGGTVSGLAGTGLVLRNNGGNNLPVNANGGFGFSIDVPSGSPYAVTVLSQPTSPSQTCTVENASGSVSGAAISNIQVNCVTNRRSVGGSITGLVGTVVLANGTDTLSVNANGTFTLDNTVASGDAYNVVVKTQPAAPSQTCTVTNGTGTIVDSNVTNVAIACETNQFAVGGTVTGLASGKSVVLQNNAGNDLTVSANGAFAFTTKITSGLDYAVTLLSGPSTQVCVVSGGTGTVGASDVESVSVNCSNKPTVGGTVSGLLGTGLTLQLNATEELNISGDGSFAFSTSFETGNTYQVAVTADPTTPWQTCSVTNGSGTIAATAVTDVAITCVSNPFNLSVNVTGLSGTGFVLQNNGADNLSVAALGVSTFATKVRSGQTYNVTVLTPPTAPSQTCTVTSPTGTVGNADITVAVSCQTNTYTVGGTVRGAAPTGMVLTNNAGDALTIAATGTFTFATRVASGVAYNVAVATQPTGNTCIVTNGTGTVAAANVTNVTVVCPIQYNFDFNTQGMYTWHAPAAGTVTWSSTEGSPTAGAVVLGLPYSPTDCESGTNIAISPAAAINVTGLTTLTARVRVDGTWPTSDRSGGIQVFMQGSNGWNTGTFSDWWSMNFGEWKTLTLTLPAEKDLTGITGFGVNIYNGSNKAICQATTVLVDSISFQ